MNDRRRRREGRRQMTIIGMMLGVTLVVVPWLADEALGVRLSVREDGSDPDSGSVPAASDGDGRKNQHEQ
jgi:hypothetical protein